MIKKTLIRLGNCIMVVALVIISMGILADTGLEARATTIKDVKDQIKDTQNELNAWNAEIANIEDELDLIEEKIEDLNAEIINMMTSIGMKEDEILKKQEEITKKEEEIAITQAEYDAAKKREEEQYDAMILRIRYAYENDESSTLNYFFESKSFSDMLDRADYLERIYEYDQNLLNEYNQTKNQVHDLWMTLETDKEGLKKDKEQLEYDREYMQNQKNELDVMLTQRKQESATYDSYLARANQEAAAAKKRLQQEQQKLRKLEQEQQRANAANGTYTVSAQQFDVSIIDKAGGSDLGKKIAKYACQYIGNPYVLGGTSLTNGADCSGFIYRVYSDFTYSLPRTSYEQRNAGTSVSYDQAQPGDIICYSGHVGIYVGGGYIVHASTAKTGIKISKATYREILSVRRII